LRSEKHLGKAKVFSLAPRRLARSMLTFASLVWFEVSPFMSTIF